MGEAGDWPCKGIDFWSFMNIDELGGGSTISDIWGWTDMDSGREFAICGVNSQTAFVEITDPENPVLVANLETATTPSLWRDMKVYNNHAFIVSEAGDHGMQVVDLTLLLDVSDPPIDIPLAAYYDGFGDAHNIVINEETGFAYGVGTNTFEGGLHIVDISDPSNPVLAGSFENDGYTHDAQVVLYNGPDPDYAAGSEIAFCFNADNLAIVDVTVKDDCQLISHGEYDETGYTHQGWITEDHKYLLLGDEGDENSFDVHTRTHIFDIQDLDNPEHMGFYSAGSYAIDHNMYINENFVYQSNYTSGLRVLDAVNVEEGELYEIGFFDVHPDNDDTGFTGTWSNYCYFPSGNVIVSDISDGLFVLRPSFMSIDPEAATVGCDDDVIILDLMVRAPLMGTLSVSVDGLPGVTATADDFTAPGDTEVILSGVADLNNGIYDYEIVLTSEYGSYTIPGNLIVEGTLPSPPALISPADMEITADNIVNFYWGGVADVDSYFIEIAEDIDFVGLAYSELVLDTTFEMPFLLLDGIYFWHVQSLNNCGQGDFSDAFQFEIIATDISAHETTQVLMFPNPVDEVLNIHSEVALGKLKVMDLSGRVVKMANMTSSKIQIDLSDLSPGYYLATTENGLNLKFIRK
jgi:choice-of-anchor B domain-containing protein